MERFVVISGCSAGGKSTLLTELASRGYAVVGEPGRRIIKEELERSSLALPWVDAAAFARRAIGVALADRADTVQAGDWVFFDRGLIDAAAALQHLTGEPALAPLRETHRYHRRVFMAPPWPELFVSDPERRHGYDDAVAEYERLVQVYPSLGYEIVMLPKSTIAERADFVMRMLET